MRIIRPSQVTVDQKQFQRNSWFAGGLLLLGLALLISAILFFLDNIVLLLILLVIALLAWGAASQFALILNSFRQRQKAIEQVTNFLSNKLNDDYLLFQNLSLPGRSTVGVIDIVLVGPFGAVVLQLETNKSEFIIDGDTWYLATGSEVVKPEPKPLSQVPEEPISPLPRRKLDYSPVWLAIRAAREVKAWLSVRGLPQVTVQPVVILSEGKVRSSRNSGVPVIQMANFESYLNENILGNKTADQLADGVVEQIADRLQANAEQIQPKLTESV